MPNNRPLLGLTNLISRGISPKYDTQGYLVLNQRCIRNHRIEYETARITNKNKSKINPEKFIRKWDVLINSTGVGTLGRVAQVLESQDNVTVDSHVSIARPKLEMLDGRYFGYALIEREPYIETLGKGATGQTELSRQSISEVIISLHSLPKQIKIAVILSAYDDLIENNLRRIKILEELAQMIYREWFVNFRFPGHEKVKMVDSDLGKIPEGWEVMNFDRLIEFHIGGGWGKDKPDNKHTETGYVIRGTDIPTARHGSRENVPLRVHKLSNIKSRMLSDGDIVFEVSGGSKDQPVGRALYVSGNLLKQFDYEVICASFCKLLRPDRSLILPELIYLHLEEIYNNKHIMQYQVQSTGITNFKFEHFLKNERLIVPTKEIRDSFADIIKPIFNFIQILGYRNTNLHKTRDLLLPKLISGELDVEKMEIDTERK